MTQRAPPSIGAAAGAVPWPGPGQDPLFKLGEDEGGNLAGDVAACSLAGSELAPDDIL